MLNNYVLNYRNNRNDVDIEKLVIFIKINYSINKSLIIYFSYKILLCTIRLCYFKNRFLFFKQPLKNNFKIIELI